ncbi:MAG: hypothetical protein ACP5IK_00385, partial [Candidatus Micrarchaeia archaeon]
IVALVVVFAVATNFETYRGFYYYQMMIKGYNYLFHQTVAYMSKINESGAIVNSQNPYLDSQYLNFVSGYEYNFTPVMGICKGSDAGALIINVFTNFDYNIEQNTLANWLGSNCTATRLISYNFSFGEGLSEAATIYQIRNASS